MYIFIILLLVFAGRFYLKNHYFIYHNGKVTDHFDGREFHNYGIDHTRGFIDFLKWRLTGDRATWPDDVSVTKQDIPPQKIEGEQIRVSMIGHATLLIQTQGLNFLTDPVFANRAGPFGILGPKRIGKLGVELENIPKIDVILLSHNHYDHMDTKAIAWLLERDNPMIITPLGNDVILKREGINANIIVCDWYDEIKINKDVKVMLTSALHWSSRWGLDKNRALWGGFVIKSSSGNIYFAGDTGYGDGSIFQKIRKQVGDINLAILPIGAYEPRWFMKFVHMNPEDAIKAFIDLGKPHVIGMHFGVFQLTDEGINDPIKALNEGLEGFSEEDKSKFRPMLMGEVMELQNSQVINKDN